MNEKYVMFSTSNTAVVAELERNLACLSTELVAKVSERFPSSAPAPVARPSPRATSTFCSTSPPDATFGLVDLVQLKNTLGDALDGKVDIAFKGGPHPYVEANMTRDARQVL